MLIVSIVIALLLMFTFKKKVENDLPPYILFIEKYFPSVIMTILIVYTLKDVNFIQFSYGLKEIGGIIFTAILHLTLKNYLISIFTGTIFYMILVQYL
jgi:branched-subunit amino acid transport protein AzlD